MKKTITLILLTISIVAFAQKNQNSEKQRIDILEQKVNALNDSIEKLKQDDASLYVLKDKIINDKIDYQKLEKQIEDTHQNWFTKYFDVGILIGAFLGLIGFWWFGYDRIKKKVAEKVGELTNRDVSHIRKNIDEFSKHINLKQNSKILILNEKGTNFPDGFKKVIRLFNISEEDIINISGLSEALKNDNICRIKEADLIIIENQVSNGKKWNIKIQQTHNITDGNRIKKIEEQNKIADNNLKLLADLANKICDKTALIYYGLSNDGFFPAHKVDADKQHFVTFANAPSQLYGNMLNMLKFKNEL